MRFRKLLLIITALFFFIELKAQSNSEEISSYEYVFDGTKKDSLKAHVFFPNEKESNDSRPAIVIFHGGGWNMGEPSWAFARAKKFAQNGMVAVAAQYRLSDQESITPIEAMEDARKVIIWMRKNSEKLKIDPDRIVAYGWSAGAHLAASAAVFPSFDPEKNISSKPNALVLYSPALSLINSGWFKKLLLNKGKPYNYSPAEHVKENMPPAIILVGKDDTVTPIRESELFHQNMVKYGNESYLHIYEGVSHLFTPSSQPDNGWPNPDKEIQAKAYKEIDLFLEKLGYFN
ncbi:alpha/beta hydrolase [Xanthovirga aplysinae]|uniref:alpha/beta hydrolase n=1 Tax=Xanthovirga aplysinae TaxID=2529853 RepID=UPI0012BD7864|nr:alpha/beta hydrolase [Xanthovirga aplysinae]MTI33114.1 alpha/beta hydrolase [Xanthovirga aplysinae]